MQKLEKNIPANIREILPNIELFNQSSDDYINSLEMAVNLLQREVENLRNQIKPQYETVDDNIKKDVAKSEFLRCATYEDIHSNYTSIISKYLPITESNIYIFYSVKKLKPLIKEMESDLLSQYFKQLIEEGIIDWAVEKKELSVIPNIYQDDNQSKSYFLIIPLYILDSAIGIFIAITPSSGVDLPNSAFAEISSQQENVAIAIDNLRSSEQMRSMNEKLSALNKQMLRTSKLASVGELTQAISKEMSTPLQIIKANLKLIKDGVGDHTRRIDIVCKEVGRIAELNSKLNNFGDQIIAEKSPEQIDVCDLFEDLLNIASSQFLRDGIYIETNYEAHGLFFLASKSQMQQAILNILFFSRDTMPDGGKISIVVSNNKNKYINILISDNGIGIDENYVSKVFDPAFSDHSSETKIKRGLFLVKNMVEQHNGRISVLSEVGKGTAFRLSFPVSEVSVRNKK
jgi:signal transduction histidine kinase